MQKTNILRGIKKYAIQTVLAPLFKLLEASFELFIPIVVSDIIDNGITNNDKTYIFSRFAILILLALVGLLCSVTSQYFSAKTAVGFSSTVRQNLFDKIQTLDFYSIDKVGTSHLINTMTSDVNQVQTGLNLTLRLFLRSPFVVFGAMIMAFRIDVKTSYIFVATIILLSLIVFGIMIITIPLYKKVQKKNDKLLSLTRENLLGSRVLRAFNQENIEIENFSKYNSDFKKNQKFVGNISGAINPLTFVIINMAIVWLIYIGSIEVNLGNLTQGNVIALYDYMTQILTELIKLANLIIQITKAIASKKRIEHILDIKNELIKNNTENKFDENAPIISFENVSMRYPTNKENSIHNITFEIFKGENIGIIGGTGAGKTTLINMIPHFYDSNDGIVKYKGIPIQNINSNLLRQRIGIVNQKSVLFKGTIRENLLKGNENATEEDMIDALKKSQSYDFVFGKDGQLDGLVEQEGKNFSGGQKQRLSIARALIKKPEILILDDSSSALDYKTDMLMRQAINNDKNILTKIIVSQRTSSIMNCDKIIVLENGYIVGIGKHKELLDNCEVYKEIYYSQYKGDKNEE